MVQRNQPAGKRKQQARSTARGAAWRWLRRIAVAAIVVAVVAAAAMVGGYFHLSEELPKISTLADYRPPVVTTVYARDHRKIAEFYRERRIVTPLDKMPATLIDAFIAAEDSRFYSHKGVDVLSILRAFFKNLEAGTIVQGGSTITQQVTKSFFLTPERSYRRKIKEAILAYRIDQSFSKDEILFLYLNQIYLGHGAYGVTAAAENYFGKAIGDLNLAECAMLAGLPQAPSRYSPYRNPDQAKERQKYVLNRMVAEAYITPEQARSALDTPVPIKSRRNWYIEHVPFYTEHVRRMVEERYGGEALLTEGLQIYTAVDIDMQRIAREEIAQGLRDLDKRQGYRGPLMHVAPGEIAAFSREMAAKIAGEPLQEGQIHRAVVTQVDDAGKSVTVQIGDQSGRIRLKDMRWARRPDPEVAYYQARVRRPGDVLRKGDVIEVRLQERHADDGHWRLSLEQEADAQAALLCIESETGAVRAMVGGRDFQDSQFNRAIQSRRQPGSAFKPVIYAAAIDRGYTPASVVIDAPIVFKDIERDFVWKPKNYKETFYGPTRLREALAKSRNVVTIKLLQDIGVDYLIDYARKLGITSELSRNLSIALGSSGVSLLELVNAYSVFANQGYRVEPTFILKVLDRDGNVLEQGQPLRERVIDTSTAFIMTNLLESVVKNGTGRRVRALERPAAGKTGTTNDLFDAWFVGYTPQLITGVWVGFDQERSLGKGETGSRTASPIWLGFMKRALDGEPATVFPVPDGVVFAKIDAESGLLPVSTSKKTLFECFKEGSVPTEYTKRPGAIDERDDFYKSLM
jgi:penicillin-binding protein 1A